jgi:sulfatase maturation enzyme AslB (radical SAM superfamily)
MTTLIERWKQRQLNTLEPIRIIATTEARCNLACEHCYWSHEMSDRPLDNWEPVVNQLAQFRVPLFFAGRILTENGVRFLRLCEAKDASSEIGIVDNGFTILKFPDLLPTYTSISISIDGWREEHDQQRGKEGAFGVAWSAIQELQRQGFDPVVSSAISPLTFRQWERFEQLLAEHDVPMSSTLVWALPHPQKRGNAVFRDDTDMLAAFEKLLNGIPKLINLYSLGHIQSLWPLLRTFRWKSDVEVGDCLVAEVSGKVIVYRPASVTSVAEQSLEWDGIFYTPFTNGVKRPVHMVDESYMRWVKELNAHELEVWAEVIGR